MQLGSTLKKSTGNRMVVPYFVQKFAAEEKKLTEFLTQSKVSIFKKQATTTENTDVVNCKNLKEITNHMLLERETQHINLSSFKLIVENHF